MKNLILNELQKITSSGFYISGKIPKDKLKNAIGHYPIPAEEDVLALIDATVFGSAKNGMAIGLKGIYWKNDWATDTVKNFLHWNDLIVNTNQITTKGNDLILSPGCVFSLAGSGVKSKLLSDLLLNIIEKISKSNEQKLEISSTDNSQKLPTNQNDDSIKNKKEIEPSSTTEKVISKPIADSRFSGKYDRNLLRLVNEISKKYRLSRHVYIAPSIQVNKAKTILDICNNSIDPFSILVIVDNTFLQTGKDFLIVTNECIMSRSMVRKLDKFNLSEIRNISCNNDEFFINNYEFQFFDQLEHSETRILVDFLNDLIPSIINYSSKFNNPNEEFIDPKLSNILIESFTNVKKEVNEEFNIENDSDSSEFLDNFLTTLYAIFEVMENNFHNYDSCGKDYLLHQFLLAYTCILSFSYRKIEEIKEDKDLTKLYLFSIQSITKNIVEAGMKNGLYIKGNTSKYYSTIFVRILMSSGSDVNFDSLLNNFLDSSPEDKKAIILAKKSIDEAIIYLNNSFS